MFVVMLHFFPLLQYPEIAEKSQLMQFYCFPNTRRLKNPPQSSLTEIGNIMI